MVRIREERPGDLRGREALLDGAFGPARRFKTAERLRRGRLRAEVIALGSIDRIKRVVRLGVWVASERGFHGQPGVANGASELMVEVFGDAGRHVRAAVGSIDLPLGAPVEVEFLFEVE